MRCVAQPAISTPLSRTLPLVGGTKPMTARVVVELSPNFGDGLKDQAAALA
jgi:hypothetical protein